MPDLPWFVRAPNRKRPTIKSHLLQTQEERNLAACLVPRTDDFECPWCHNINRYPRIMKLSADARNQDPYDWTISRDVLKERGVPSYKAGNGKCFSCGGYYCLTHFSPERSLHYKFSEDSRSIRFRKKCYGKSFSMIVSLAALEELGERDLNLVIQRAERLINIEISKEVVSSNAHLSH